MCFIGLYLIKSRIPLVFLSAKGEVEDLAWDLGGLGSNLTLAPGGFLTLDQFLALSRLEFYHLKYKEIGLDDLNSETLLFL